MNRSNPSSVELVAPCGMNCAICSRHLAYVNHLKRSPCAGCRPRNEGCAYLFARCAGINHAAKGKAVFCFECSQYPCQQINRMDDRYRNNYGMSVKANLARIKKMGVNKFIREQYRKYRCSKCSGWISVHNKKCFQCDKITRLVEKHAGLPEPSADAVRATSRR
jgi:hypothetical protein